MAALDSGSLGALIGTFATHIVHADSMSKREDLERNIQALNEGNFDWNTYMSLIGMEDKLELNINVPKAILMPLQPILITRALLKINMDVSSHEESSKQLDSEEEVSGKATVGFGLFKASMSMRAKLGQHISSKRSTDNRSTCEAELEMGQGETPEGVSRLLDASLMLVDKGLDMNMSLIEIQEQIMRGKLLDSAETNDDGNGGSDDGNFIEDNGNSSDSESDGFAKAS